MTAVRDHPERPAATQRHVLVMLALRMDWRTGCGSVSGAQLAADAECEQRTVKRATSWARGAGLLVQTRRGHRLGDGTTRASEWQLAISTGQGCPVEPVSRGQNPGLKGTEQGSQGDTSTPPSRTRSSRPSSSARGDAPDGARTPHATQTPAGDMWLGSAEQQATYANGAAAVRAALNGTHVPAQGGAAQEGTTG